MRQRYCLYGLLVTTIVRYNDHWLPASRSFQLQNDWQTFAQTGTEATPIQINKHAHVHVFIRFCFIDIRWVCRSYSFEHHFSLFICNRTHTHAQHELVFCFFSLLNVCACIACFVHVFHNHKFLIKVIWIFLAALLRNFSQIQFFCLFRYAVDLNVTLLFFTSVISFFFQTKTKTKTKKFVGMNKKIGSEQR